MAEISAQAKFRERLEGLPRADKILLGAFFALAFLSLIIGDLTAFLLASVAGGFIKLSPVVIFQILTLHPTYAFYYWLYSVMIGTIFTFILVYTEGARVTPTLRKVAWLGFSLMALGFLLNLTSVVMGAAPTYRAEYPLIKQFGTAGVLFFLGYISLALGLFVSALMAIATAIRPKREGTVKEWSAITFASVIWMALIVVTLVASLLTYLPALQDALGRTPFIENFKYSMSWGVMFHNLHYLPIMGAVLVWYVLAELTTGIKSVFSERFSKGIFALYLFFVPPTSVYHMFLEPNVPLNVKVIGSILSLGVSIPTIAVAVLILTSLHACSSGKVMGTSLGWIRTLPWRNPSFAALAMAMTSALAGGVVANILIQEKFAVLIGDTFAVPGYFHFFTLGAVTLAFFGILTQILPALTGHRIWMPSLMGILPYGMIAFTYLFGIAGVLAGYSGVPRRTLEYSFGGAAPPFWGTIMPIVGIAGVLMAVSSGVYVLLLILTALKDTPSGARLEELPISVCRVEDAAGQKPWSSFLVVALLLVGIYLASIGANELIQRLPLIAAGGGH
jgi:cytochrome c oxidase subunit 1